MTSSDFNFNLSLNWTTYNSKNLLRALKKSRLTIFISVRVKRGGRFDPTPTLAKLAKLTGISYAMVSTLDIVILEMLGRIEYDHLHEKIPLTKIWPR